MNIERMQRIEFCLRDYAAHNDCWEVDMHNWSCCALGIIMKQQLFKKFAGKSIVAVDDITQFLDISLEEFNHIFGSPKFGEISNGRDALLVRADRVSSLLNRYVTVEKLKEKSLEGMEV